MSEVRVRIQDVVGEQHDPEREQRRRAHARKALALLNCHVIENGPGQMTIELFQEMTLEAAEQVGEEDAVGKTGLRLATGMTYLAWELLALREAEVGKTATETLEDLGGIFSP